MKTLLLRKEITFMSQLKICSVLTAVILALALSGRAQKSEKMGPDETAVRQIVQHVQDGWNAHDAKAFAAPFNADADYVIVNGMHINGRDAIEKGHIGIFATIYKDSRNIAAIKSVRFLRKDVAVVHVEWNLEFIAGGKTQRGRAFNTMIMTKDNGKWGIAAFQNTPIQMETH